MKSLKIASQLTLYTMIFKNTSTSCISSWVGNISVLYPVGGWFDSIRNKITLYSKRGPLRHRTYVLFSRENQQEFSIFQYFPVVPSGSTFSYVTKKQKMNRQERQKNLFSTNATADPQTYLLLRSAIKKLFSH